MINDAQRRLLHAIGQGWRLRDHRDLEGRKWFDLTREGEPTQSVDPADVAALIGAGLIDSNKKFPAATYWLTQPDTRRQAGKAAPL